ncbi:hypothetical protein DVH05_022304 [Phytophthora capsici]|nr:hypothetical protein DVH05_022304 [Phytophthora capsici]
MVAVAHYRTAFRRCCCTSLHCAFFIATFGISRGSEMASWSTSKQLMVRLLPLLHVLRRRVGVHVEVHLLEHALVRRQQRHLAEPRAQQALGRFAPQTSLFGP